MQTFPNIVTAGQPFSFQLEATNNPTVWAIDHIPDGLALDSATGIISGTIANPGVYAFQLTAANGAGTSAPMFVFILVSAPDGPAPLVPTIQDFTAGNNQPNNLISINALDDMRWQLYATNEPTSWAMLGAPVGISIDSNGFITGTISATGRYAFAVTATNEHGTSAAFELSITVGPSVITAIAPYRAWLNGDPSLIDMTVDVRSRAVTSSFMQGDGLHMWLGDGDYLGVLLLDPRAESPGLIADATNVKFAIRLKDDNTEGYLLNSTAFTAIPVEGQGTYYKVTFPVDSPALKSYFADVNDTPGNPASEALSAVGQVIYTLAGGAVQHSAVVPLVIHQSPAAGDL